MSTEEQLLALMEQFKQLQAENERLKEALKEIAKDGIAKHCNTWEEQSKYWQELWFNCYRKAQQALQESEAE